MKVKKLLFTFVFLPFTLPLQGRKGIDMTNDLWLPDEAMLRKIDIHELLPQQEPFVMVGKLIGFDRTRTVTETTVSSQNILTEDGKFSATGVMENIAQTCAARIGYVNKYILKRGIQIGLIGAISNMDIVGLPRAGETIVTTLEVEQQVFGMTLAKAVVTCGGKTLASAEMKMAVREEDSNDETENV